MSQKILAFSNWTYLLAWWRPTFFNYVWPNSPRIDLIHWYVLSLGTQDFSPQLIKPLMFTAEFLLICVPAPSVISHGVNHYNRRLSACTPVPHRQGNSMGGPPLFNIMIRNRQGSEFLSGIELWDLLCPVCYPLSYHFTLLTMAKIWPCRLYIQKASDHLTPNVNRQLSRRHYALFQTSKEMIINY